MLNKRALLKLGWTPALIQSILGKPDEEKEHKHGFKRWIEHRHSQSRVDAGMKDSRFVAAVEKRKKRAQLATARIAAIPERYPSWKDALPEAAAGMKQLNRYAKHRICTPARKTEIYLLKNEFIAALYKHDYCTAAWIHRQNFPEQPCRECGGSGGDCDHCDGSGIWREARTVELWCFRFLIGGQTYVWHQPRASVKFAPVESVPPQDLEGFIGEKPVTLPKRKFKAAMELLRWLIDRAAFGEEPTPATEIETLPFDHSWPDVRSRVFAATKQLSLFS